MKHNTFSKTAVAATMVAVAFSLTACSDNDDDNMSTSSSYVRVIHASHDAPKVNIKLDNATAIGDLDYGESTGFAQIPAGVKDVAVEAIIPGGNSDVIEIPSFDFEEEGRYTIIAVNDTATIDYLAAAESASTPADTEIAVAVAHTAFGVGEVGVYVTAPNVTLPDNTTFNFDYKAVVDAGVLPAAAYQIRVDSPAGSGTVVYDSGEIDLTAFGGEKLLISAIRTVSSTNADASPVKLLAATDSAALTLYDVETSVGARVVHVSSNAGTVAAGPVEVFATSTVLGMNSPLELIDAFEYEEAFPDQSTNLYASVPAGDYVFDVAVDNSGIDNSVYTSNSLALTAGTEYTVLAAGLVGGNPAFGLLSTVDNNREIVTQASVKVVHAAPSAGSVDVYVTPAGSFTTAQVESGAAGAPLLDDFNYESITDYVAVAHGDYDIRVIPTATGTTAIDISATLAAGSVSTVIAREPDGDGTPADFGVILLTN